MPLIKYIQNLLLFLNRLIEQLISFCYSKVLKISKRIFTSREVQQTPYKNKSILSKTFKLAFILISFVTFIGITYADEFRYKGTTEEYIIPYDGYYKLEAWGAQGGSAQGENNTKIFPGGYGEYSTGVVKLNKGDKIYVTVGGSGLVGWKTGQSLAGGFNGGGDVVGNSSSPNIVGSGGGATHIALVPGTLKEVIASSNYSNNVLIVAAGGGGAKTIDPSKLSSSDSGWVYLAAAGMSGVSTRKTATPAKLGAYTWNSSTNSFTYADDMSYFDRATFDYGLANNYYGYGESGYGQAGGGGGYYGGRAGWIETINMYGSYVTSGIGSAAGGISHNTVLTKLINYESYKKYDIQYTPSSYVDDGETSCTNHMNVANCAKMDSGYARITLIKKIPNSNTNLATLNATNGSYGFFTSSFNPSTHSYSVSVPSNISRLNVTATPEVSTTTVSGTGIKDLNLGNNVITVTTTAEDGSVSTYTINVYRKSGNAYLSDIKLDNKSITNFNSSTFNYNIEVPSSSSMMSLSAVKGDSTQTLYYPDVLTLNYGNNTYNIVVTAEDGTVNIYILNINRIKPNLITNIYVDDYTMEPTFNVNKNTYDLDIYDNIDSINIHVIKNSEINSTVTGDGVISLTSNETTHNIVATDNDGATTTYTLYIHKSIKTDNTISRVDIGNNGNVDKFVNIISGQTNYNIEVDKTYTLFNYLNIATNNTQQTYKYKLNGNYITNGIFSIPNNSDTLEIEVYDKLNKLINTYTITITKAKSKIATLDNLSVNVGYLKESFSSDKNDYTWVIPKTTTEVFDSNVIYTTTDDKATVTMPDSILYTGNNDTFNVAVLAEDNTTSNIYTLTLEREISNDARLKTLSIEGFTLSPVFESDTYSYNLSIYDNTTSIDVSATTMDSDATITSGIGTITTNNNFIHKIVVTAEDGTINTYIINVSKNILSDNTIKQVNIGNNTITDYTVTIEENKYNYDLTLPYNYDSFNYIDVISNNSQLTYKYYLNNELIIDEFNLSENNNNLEIEVYNKINKLVGTYTININRVKATISTLDALNVKYGDIEPSFNKNTLEYTWTMPKNITSISKNDIEATPTDKNANVTIPEDTNAITNNIINIVVTAEDGITKTTYKLTVQKEISNDARLKTLAVENGKYRTKFNSDTYTYEIDTYTTSESVTITATTIDSDARITDGLGTVTLTSDDTTHTITTIAEDNTTTKTYTLNIHKTIDQSNNSINSILIGNDNTADYSVLIENGVTKYSLDVLEDYKTFNYIETTSDNPDLSFRYYLNGTEITTTGNILEGANTLKVEVYDSLNNLGNTYTVTINREVERDVSGGGSGSGSSVEVGDYEFWSGYNSCSISNEYISPVDGYYELEVWGASGGVYGGEYGSTADKNTKHLGGYSVGIVKLNKGEILYPVPGGMGGRYTDPAGTNYGTGGAGGCNGGGKGGNGSYNYGIYHGGTGGGGASHIALRQGFLKDLEEYKEDVLIVAGGGPGALGRQQNNESFYGGFGGGYVGIAYNNSEPIGASQTSGYAFGQGEDSTYDSKPGKSNHTTYYGGAGGGYYGGTQTSNGQTSGGSGFIGNAKLISYGGITKHMGVGTSYNISDEVKQQALSDDENTKTIWIDVSDTSNVSNYDKSLISNSTWSNDYYGSDKLINGHGGARITLIENLDSPNLNLKSLVVSNGTLTPEFNGSTYAYSLTVDTSTINIAGELEDETNAVTGLGVISVPAGTSIHNITITNGTDSQTYALTITREASSNAYLDNIVFNGNEVNGFNKETFSYNLEVSDLTSATITPVKGHDGQTLVYESPVSIGYGNNAYEIEVTAEDGVTKNTYTINVYKESHVGLKDLYVENFNLYPEFDEETNNYELHVYDNTESINIVGTLIDEDAVASVTGLGTLSLNSNEIEHTIVVTGKDDSNVTYTINIYKDVSSIDYLNNIEIVNNDVVCPSDKCILNPTFEGTKIGYTFDVPYTYDSFDLNITKGHESQTYKTKLNGVETNTYTLNEGSNTLKVELYNGLNKLVRTYTITINRNKSGDATLKTLTSDTGKLTPNFNGNTYNYNLDVYEDTTSITLSATTNNPYATILSTLGEIDLTSNPTVKTIEVEAEDGTQATYTININKSVYRESKLENITLIASSGNLILNPLFDSDTVSYIAEIPYRDELIDVLVETKNNQQTYNIKLNDVIIKDNTYTLNENNNVLIVEVIDGVGKSVNNYTINIDRVKSNVATLDSLAVNLGSIKETFASDTFTYTWVVPKNTSEILNSNITYTLTDELSTASLPDSVTYTEDGDTYTITVTAEDGTTTNDYVLTLEEELSTENKLLDLTSNKGKLVDEFDSDVNTYTLYLYEDEENVTITATPKDEYEIVTGDGEYTLTDDLNSINVVVTPEDGDINTYIINISKSIKKTINATDIDIYNDNYEAITGYTFDSDIYSYNMVVPYLYDNFKLNVDIDEQQSYKVKIADNYTEDYNLIVGNNKVEVEIYDGLDNKTNTYTFNINRLESDNNYLRELDFRGYILTPEFNKDTLEYRIELEDDTNSLTLRDIIATPEDERATVTVIGYDSLSEDRNDITIRVTAPNGDTRDYLVHANKGIPTNLISLEVTNNDTTYDLTPEFNPYVYSYSTTVPNEITSIDISAVAEFPDDITITGIGTYELEVGDNKINVVAMAETGRASTYTVTITREVDKNVDLESLEVLESFDTLEFDKDTLDYYFEVSDLDTVLTINAIPENPLATVEVTGNNIRATKGWYNKDTDNGYANTVKVTVYNSNKTVSKTYTLHVARTANDNTNINYLNIWDDKNRSIYYNCPVFNEDYSGTCNIEAFDDTAYVYTEIFTEVGTTKPYISGYYNKYNATTYKSTLGPANLVVQAESGRQKSYSVNYINRTNYAVELGKIVQTAVKIDGQTIEEIRNINYDEDEEAYILDVTSGTTQIDLAYEYLGHNTFTFNGQKMKNVFNGDISGLSRIKEKYHFSKNPTYYLLKNLHPGDNVGIISLSKLDRSSEFKVIIRRPKDENNYIKELTVDGLWDKAFDKETQEYTIDVKPDVNMLDLGVTLESEYATYEVLGNENISMENNPNEVTIRVTAQNGDTRDYTLNVNVREIEFFSNGLRDIIVKHNDVTYNLNPEFVTYTNNYNVEVPYETDSVDISVVKQDSLQAVTYNGNSLGNSIPLSIGRNLVTINVTSASGEETTTYNVIINRAKSNDATLKSLTIEGHEYTPYFNKNTLSYSLNVDSTVSSLDIKAVPSEEEASVIVDGYYGLVAGDNEIVITVTAPDRETTKEYTINVNKAISTNNYLSSLSIDGYEFNKEFSKTDQGPYIVNVDNDVSIVDVIAEPEVITTTISGDGLNDIAVGDNTINIVTTSESGDIRTYTIIVNRAKSSNSLLSDIFISDGTMSPTFDPETLSYEVRVGTNIDEINITGIPMDSNATVTGNDYYDILNEETDISLVVTSEDETSTTTYNIKVIKEVAGSPYLKSLIVKDGELYPNFHKLTTSYTILIPNEITNLNMIYEPEDPLADVTITGNENFKVGNNTVYIDVYGTDGYTTMRYEISVVRQNKANNYLKYLRVDDYELVPTFDKLTMYYEVTVPGSVKDINIEAEAEDMNATIVATALGKQSLNKVSNTYYIPVESASGVIRTYTVVVNKDLTTEDNKLLTLESDKGTFDKEFNPDTNDYTLTIPANTDKITITGTVSEDSTATGLGEVEITNKDFNHDIVVTSPLGSINTYTINIVSENGISTDLKYLIPDNGELNPEFTNDNDEYEIIVNDGVNIINFEAEPVETLATVNGLKMNTLDYGLNEITITVTAEDGTTTRNIKINVTRAKKLERIDVEKDSIVIGKEEEYTIVYTLVPEDATNKELEFISSNSDIVTVSEEGIITGVNYGTTSVRVVSNDDENIYKDITVRVLNKVITSEVYDIERFDDKTNDNPDGYTGEKQDFVIGAETEVSIEEFKKNFNNEPATLFVYDKEGNKIEDETTFVATGMKLKLVIDDEVFDELDISVRGDLDGDGIITMADYTKMKNQLLTSIQFNYLEFKAADLDYDNTITMADYSKLKNFLLGDIDTLNPTE